MRKLISALTAGSVVWPNPVTFRASLGADASLSLYLVGNPNPNAGTAFDIWVVSFGTGVLIGIGPMLP